MFVTCDVLLVEHAVGETIKMLLILGAMQLVSSQYPVVPNERQHM